MNILLKKLFTLTLVLCLILPISATNARAAEIINPPEPINLYYYFLGNGRFDLAFKIPANNTATEYIIWENNIILQSGTLETNNTSSYNIFTTHYNKPDGTYNIKVTLYNFAGSSDSNTLELILNSPDSYWTSQRNYLSGDIIDFNNSSYRCIISHTAQSPWTPDVTPTLWQKI